MKKIVSLVLGTALCCAAVSPLAGCGGSNGGLDAMPQYTEEKTMLIGGWSEPPSTLEDYQKAADCGLDFIFLGATYDARGSEGYTEALDFMQQVGMQAILQVGTAQGNDPLPYEWAAEYKDHEAVLGINYWDEPTVPRMEYVAENAQWHNQTFAGTDKTFYVNLYPTYVDSAILAGTYDEYLEKYVEIMDSVTVGEKWISYDYYPLRLGVSGSALDTGWLNNLERIAKVAKDSNADVFHAFLLTTQHMEFRECSEADLRYQAWVNMAYGANSLSHFTYRGSQPGQEWGNAPVTSTGTIQPMYYAVQQVNKELHAIDDVYLAFDWQGVYTVTGSIPVENMDNVDANGVSTYFRKLDYSLKELQAIQSVEATQNTLVGEFTDKDGNHGYVVTNFADPYFEEESDSSVTLHFKNANRAIVCYGGEIKTYQVTDNTLTLDLDAGDGAFVIPVLLNI